MGDYIKSFSDIDIDDIALVGGKNASLGEMFQKLSSKKVQVPDGFAVTSDAYWYYLEQQHLKEGVFKELQHLDIVDFSNLKKVGAAIRNHFSKAVLPTGIKEAIQEAYAGLIKKYGTDISLAIRSSATAEDLPNASFAGQ